MNWISVEDQKPKDRKNVLLLVVLQRFCDGVHCKDEIVITGGTKDGEWFVGNEMLLWDFNFNAGFCDDDITHWMPLPEPPTDAS